MNVLYYLAAIAKPDSLPTTEATGDKLQAVLQVVFLAFGSIALIVVTLAGFKYVVSQGDPGSVEKAKNTILYALVGLVISLSAWAIVTYVLEGLLK